MIDRDRKSSATILFATYICLEVVYVAAIVTAPTWRNIFAFSQLQLGICLAASQAGPMVAGPFVGRITARLGPVRMIRCALLAMLAAVMTVSLANGFTMIVIGLAVVGLSAAAVHNGATTVLAELFQGRVRRVMALASALWFGSSIISAPLIGKWLDLSQQYELQNSAFRLLFLFITAALLVCLILIKKRLSEPQHNPNEEAVKSDHSRPTQNPTNREWLWIPFLGACHGMMVMTLTAWLNPMSQAVFGSGDFYGGLLFGVAALGLASGRFLLAACHFKIDDRGLLTFSGCLGSIILIIALQAPTYWTTFILIGLAALTVSSTAPCLFSLIGERFTVRRSRLFGYFEASLAAAAGFGAFAVGALVDLGMPVRLAMGLSPAAALALALGSLIWRLQRP